MKITEVKVWLVEGVKYNWTLMKVFTDTGHTGVGEATNWPGSPIIEAAAKHVGERVIGLDPLRTDFIWTKLYRDLNWIGPFGASMCAISGLDMALLDLKAKVLGVPMYQLMGGAFRTSIPLYANYWFTGGGHTAEDYASQARKVMAAGFGGLKFDPFAHTNYLYGTDLNTNLALTPQMQDRAVEVTAAVRGAIGPQMDMMIETHAMMNGQMAVRMAERLAPYGMETEITSPDRWSIKDLRAMDHRQTLQRMRHLGKESAERLRNLFPLALTRYRHVLVATHVPPFDNAVYHKGKPADCQHLPHFCNLSVGLMLIGILRAFPRRRVSVLAGHSHGACSRKITGNLVVRVGASRKGGRIPLELIRIVS